MSTYEPNDSELEVEAVETDDWGDDPREGKGGAPGNARPEDRPDDAMDDAPDDREQRVVRRPNPLPSREEEEEELAEADIRHELDLDDPAIGDDDLDA